MIFEKDASPAYFSSLVSPIAGSFSQNSWDVSLAKASTTRDPRARHPEVKDIQKVRGVHPKKILSQSK
jgi:hypothetical protein